MADDGYSKALPDQESLAIFLKAMRKFDKFFCDLLANDSDFTLKLEIRGNQGELLHARVYTDEQERPDGVEKRIEAKKESRRRLQKK